MARGGAPVSCDFQGEGRASLDPDQWWTSAREAFGQVRASLPSPSEEAALSISSQGLSFVLLDEHDRPLAPAISTLDSRATEQAGTLAATVSEAELFRLTGKRASPYYLLPKLLWLKEHQADLVARAKRLAFAMDYLASRLLGAPAPTDHVLASGSLLHDIRRLQWCDQLAEDFHIDLSLLPALAWAGKPLGPISDRAASELGLPRKTLLAVGSQDQKCAALAANLSRDVSTVSLGTAAALEFLSDEARLDPQRRLPAFPHVLPGNWLLEGVLPAAGGALRWFASLTADGASGAIFSALEKEAAKVEWHTTPLFVPHLGGAGSPHWDPTAQGAFYGLTLATGRGELVRSIMEGVCFELLANLEVARGLDLAPSAVRVFGGGARSDLWLQLLADAFALPVSRLSLVDTAAYGACLLAARATGHGLPTVDSAHQHDAFSPDPEGVARARLRRKRYLQVSAHAGFDSQVWRHEQ